MSAAEIEAMRRAMEAAAASLDFEEARRLRDRLNLLRGGAAPEAAQSADTSGIARQQPGRMGIGTSRAGVVPPESWVKPAKPDPMTRGKNR